MYRRLLSNTVLFSVSTFGSKILLFLLTPFYTSILTDAEYGVTDLIIQTGNVLIPLVSMGIINAVLRFGLDETTDLKGLFTTGLVVILVGEGVLALCYPLLQSIGLLLQPQGYLIDFTCQEGQFSLLIRNQIHMVITMQNPVKLVI